MKYEIRPIEENDIEGLWYVLDYVAKEQEYVAFEKGPSIEKIKQFVQNNIENQNPQFVCLVDNRVVGWCDVIPSDRSVFAHTGFLGLGLLPDYRGIGCGSAMISMALEAAKARSLKRIKLTVFETNHRAIYLYKKLGFQQEGILQKEAYLKGRYLNVFSMGLWIGQED